MTEQVQGQTPLENPEVQESLLDRMAHIANTPGATLPFGRAVFEGLGNGAVALKVNGETRSVWQAPAVQQ